VAAVEAGTPTSREEAEEVAGAVAVEAMVDSSLSSKTLTTNTTATTTTSPSSVVRSFFALNHIPEIKPPSPSH
jgi:hypothetical protein